MAVDLDHEPAGEVAAIRELARSGWAKTMVFSGLDNQAACKEAIAAGVAGLNGKQREALETIPKAIEKLHKGQFWEDAVGATRQFIWHQALCRMGSRHS
ncbi:MAG TPA: hypothetical protein VFI43_03715 [Nitrosospira sp.]|nr:hypothetical protein [Nitrosospira sp.]